MDKALLSGGKDCEFCVKKEEEGRAFPSSLLSLPRS